MFFSPLSELPSIGRNWIYIITFALYLIFTVGTAVANNFGGLITMRFIAGFFGSPALATGGATLQDMYDIAKLPYGISLWVAAATMGPALGPTLGGFAAAAKGWRWPMWEQVWLAGPVLIVMFFVLPETSAPNILLRRAARLRRTTGIEHLRSAGEIEQASMSFSLVLTDSLIRPLQIAVVDPGTGFVNAYVALVYAIYYVRTFST
jgi:MFS transporter, DHA1 family, multidrug resistance protein